MYENVWDRQSLLFQIKLLKDRVEAFERIFRRCRTSILFSAGQRPHGFWTNEHVAVPLHASRTGEHHITMAGLPPLSVTPIQA